MNPIKQYIEELCEGSYTESDIPDKFYLVIRKLDDKVCRDLANHELRGVKGVSATRNILPAWFDVRDVAIEMDGKEFERLNKLSKINYENPDYLVSNNFAVMLRIKDQDRPSGNETKISNYAYESVLKQVVDGIKKIGLRDKDSVWLTKVLSETGFDKHTGKLYGYSQIVLTEGFPTINSVNDFVNWIWSNKHRITEKSPYSYGGFDDYKNEAYDQSKLNKARIDKIIRMALTEFGLHYRDREAEWLIKKEWIEGGQDRILRIPKGSRLIVKRGQPSEWAHNSAQYNEMYVEHYGLDKLYRITWVDPKKYEKAATKQSEKYFKSVQADKAKWRADVRKEYEKEIKRDAKLKQLAAARDAKKAKQAQKNQSQVAAESFWIEGLDLSEATLYHGSKFPDIVECEEGICLAYNMHVADEYASDLYDYARLSNPMDYDEEPKSTVYTVDVSDGIKIAKTIDLKRAYSKVYRIPIKDLRHVIDSIYEAADDEEVRKELRNQGFDAIQYMDESPTMKRHKTLRILNPSVIKITGKESGMI